MKTDFDNEFSTVYMQSVLLSPEKTMTLKDDTFAKHYKVNVILKIHQKIMTLKYDTLAKHYKVNVMLKIHQKMFSKLTWNIFANCVIILGNEISISMSNVGCNIYVNITSNIWM